MFRGELSIHRLDHDIKTKRLAVPLVLHAYRKPRIGRPWRRQARFSKKLVAQRITHAGLVGDHIVESQFIEAAPLLALGEFVEIHFGRALPSVERAKIGAVAL